MPLPLFAAIVLLQENTERKEAQRWLAPLQTALGRCGAAFVDLPPPTGVAPFDRPVALARLDDFGAAMAREHRFVGGAHLMLRRWANDGPRAMSLNDALRNWLSGLATDDRTKLAKGESIGDLPPEARTLLTRFAFAQNAAVGARMLEGDPSYRVSLSAIVVADVRDPKTHEVTAMPLPDRVFKLDPPVARASEPLPTLPAEAADVAEKSEGPIDFGKGVILTLEEAVAQATGADGLEYAYDHRLARSLVFLKGRFSAKGFLAALKEMGTVEEPTEASTASSVRLDDLGRSLADVNADAPEAVRDLLKSKSEKTVGQIMGETSALSGFLGDLHVPTNDTMSLRVVPTLWITGPGSVVDPLGSGTVNGKPVPLLVVNQVGLVIDR